MPGRGFGTLASGRTKAALALGLLVALAGGLGAQAVEPPQLEESGRLYRVGIGEVRGEGRLVDALDKLEAASPERRTFVVLAKDGPAAALARATVDAWTRAAERDARLPWRTDSSYLVVATQHPPEIALEAPPAVRDRLGISPFQLEKLAGRTFAPAALRDDLAAGVESFVRDLAAKLDEWQRDSEQDRVAVLETDAKPPSPDVSVNALSRLLDSLEGRTLALASRGIDVKAVEPPLLAARADLRRAVLALPEKPEIAALALKRAEAAVALASSTVERLEGERAQVRERASRLETEARQVRADLAESAPGIATELDRALAKIAEARKALDLRPYDAERTLDDAQLAIARARALAPPPAPPAPPETKTFALSLKRVLGILMALVPLLALAVVLALREARGAAREGYWLRREQVERDARELKGALDTLLELRDHAAHPQRVAVPISLAVEMGLASPPVPAPGANGSGPHSKVLKSEPGKESSAPSEVSPATTSSSSPKPEPVSSKTPTAPVLPIATVSLTPPAGTRVNLATESAAALRALEESGVRRVADSSRRASLAGLAEASARVRALEDRFELPAAAAFGGETASLLVRANAAIADVSAAWDSAEGSLGDAEGRSLRATFFDGAPFVEARAVLDLAPSRVDLEPRVELARSLLGTLVRVSEQARDALAFMRAALARTEEALDAAVAGGLAPLAFEDELAQAHDLAREAVFSAAADPVRATALADSAADHARRLAGAIARAEAVLGEIGKVSEAVARTGERVARRGPIPDDDPTFLHERALAGVAEALSALELGVPEESEKELARARDQLALAEEALGHRDDAKASGPSALDERRREAREARESLGRAREALGALEVEFARESWEELAAPFVAGEATAPALDAALDDASALLGQASGRAARARVHLLRLDAHLTELRRVAASVERRLAGLRDDRSNLPKRASELERRLRELEQVAKEEQVALRAETLARLEHARNAVEAAAKRAREVGEKPDLASLIRDLDALDLELDELHSKVAHDGFLCRRAIHARRAAELGIRHVEDARRRGRDRLVSRHREARARDLLDRTEPSLTRPESDWAVVLDAYASAIRACQGARELAGRREGAGSDLRHALREARRALRAAEGFDAAFVRADAEPARVLLRRALESAEAGDEAQAVENAERAAGAADEARRAAVDRACKLERDAERQMREQARGQRHARERLERKRLVAEAARRAVWLARRFGGQGPKLSFDASAEALKSVEV